MDLFHGLCYILLALLQLTKCIPSSLMKIIASGKEFVHVNLVQNLLKILRVSGKTFIV